jgi:hypothetical protein
VVDRSCFTSSVKSIVSSVLGSRGARFGSYSEVGSQKKGLAGSKNSETLRVSDLFLRSVFMYLCTDIPIRSRVL